MIVDCFPFYNELGMLKYRLETLSPVVDKFVLVESPRTFRGNPKKLYYQENKHLFEKYSDKIVHVIDNNLVENPGNPWMNDAHQRNYVQEGLYQLRLGPNDVVLLSDADEIFDPEVIRNIEEHLVGPTPFVSLDMDLYYYNIETKLELPWPAPKAARYSYFRGVYPHAFRNGSTGKVVPNAGWHLSYFGNPKMIINKLKNFAHNEFSEVYSYDDEARVSEVVQQGRDLVGRDIKFVKVPVESNPRLPPRYTEITTIVDTYDR
jgi:beta-1,4-mannosyl-glycoprotein beta-1,4-N-acetylglucosaminyltransferase